MKMDQGRVGMVKNWKKMAAAGLAAAIIFIGVLLAACLQVPSQQPIDTTMQGTKPVQVNYLDTPAFLASLTHYSTPSITQTTSRVYSSLPTGTPDNYSATGMAINTMIAPFPNHCGMEDVFSSYNMVSPDGEWLANYCSTNSKAMLQVIRQDGSTTWTVLPEDFKNASSVTSGLIPLHWSSDSRWVYFVPIYVNAPDSGLPYISLHWGPLYRLDVQNGQWAGIVSAAPWSTYYSFSPTDRRLIYIDEIWNNPARSINIIDLKSGDIHPVPVDGYYEVGAIAWASDGLSFAFIGAKVNLDFSIYGADIYTYDIESTGLRKIVSFNSDLCFDLSWDDTKTITVSCSQMGHYPQVSRFSVQYNLETKALSTPSPLP
jgi:hypothetical protein